MTDCMHLTIYYVCIYKRAATDANSEFIIHSSAIKAYFVHRKRLGNIDIRYFGETGEKDTHFAAWVVTLTVL